MTERLSPRQGQDRRKAVDGGFSEGWRLVRKGGRVKAAKAWFRHDALIPYVGQRVLIQLGDFWGRPWRVQCFTDKLCICEARMVPKP